MYLCELALDMARHTLSPAAILSVKVFQGEGIDEWMKLCRQEFVKCQVRKPDASRARSKEVYLVAKQFKARSN